MTIKIENSIFITILCLNVIYISALLKLIHMKVNIPNNIPGRTLCKNK